MFERWHSHEERLTNVTGGETFHYIEANVLANIIYKQRGAPRGSPPEPPASCPLGLMALCFKLPGRLVRLARIDVIVR